MRHFLRQPVLFATLFVFPLAASAQILIGVRGGPLLSQPTIGKDDVATFASTRAVDGFSLGATIQLPMTGNVALVIEPGYVRKGLKVAFEPAVFLNEWTTRLEYIELPFSLKLSFLNESVRPYITAGSAVAYKLTETSTLSGNGQQSIELPEQFARYDVTLTLGGGFSLAILDLASFFIDGRYSFGLNNIDKTGAAGIKSAEWRIAGGFMVAL